MKIEKQIDFIVTSLIVFIVSIAFILTQWTYPEIVLKPLYLGFLIALLPTFYLGFRIKKPWKKILLASALFGIIIASAFELIQLHNGSWIVDLLVFPWKLFGVLPIDNVIGYFIMTIFTLTFYEHFFGSFHIQYGIPQRFYRELKRLSIFVIFVLALYWINPNIFSMPYSYLVYGTVATSLTLFGLIRHPELINKAIKISLYFFFVWFMTELAAVYTGGWSYPGMYIGWVEVFGVEFPFEELFFWMFWYAPFLIVGYEHAMRDKTI